MSSDTVPPQPVPEATEAAKPVIIPEPEEPSPPAPTSSSAAGPGVATPPPSAPGSPVKKPTKKAVTEADKKAEYISAKGTCYAMDGPHRCYHFRVESSLKLHATKKLASIHTMLTFTHLSQFDQFFFGRIPSNPLPS